MSLHRGTVTQTVHIYVCYVRFNEFILCLCVCVRAELPPAGEGDLCVVSEDGLSSGEAGGQSARLPQLLLPLLALQHQTEVRTTPTHGGYLLRSHSHLFAFVLIY